MNYREFLKNIKDRELKRVYLCYGMETYLRDWIISELKETYIDKSFESLNYIYLDGREVSTDNIINACETLPFMSEKKIVVIENLNAFSGTKGSSNVDEAELGQYVTNLNNTTCIVFIVNEEKIDNRKKIVKNIKTNGSIIEFSKLKDSELGKWVAKSFNKFNKSISKKSINYFIENSGYLESGNSNTLYDIENEIIKICNYLGNRKEVIQEDIDSILTKSLENNIFKLVDGIGQKNLKEALVLFNEMLLANVAPQKILFMIIRQFRLIFIAKLLEQKGYSLPNITQKLGIPQFIAKKILEQSRNFTEQELEKGLERCLKTDEDIKKGNIDSKLGIEVLLAGFF